MLLALYQLCAVRCQEPLSLTCLPNSKHWGDIQSSNTLKIRKLQIEAGASAYFAMVHFHARTYTDAARCADAALFLAKSSRKNTAIRFEPGMDETFSRRAELEQELRTGVAEQTVTPHDQPSR